MESDWLLEVSRGDNEEPFLDQKTYVYPHDKILYSSCEDNYNSTERCKSCLHNVNILPILNILQLLNFFTFLGFFIYYVIYPKSIETIYVPASFGCVLVQMSLNLIKEWVLIENPS